MGTANEAAAHPEPAPARPTAGPWLRYQNTRGASWLGSVLFLTRGEDGAANGGPGNQAGTALPDLKAPRLLLLEDGGGAAKGSAAAAVAAPPPTLLDTCQGWQFWRFELEFELLPRQRLVTYCVEWDGGAAAGAPAAAATTAEAAAGSVAGGGGRGPKAREAAAGTEAAGAAAAQERFQFWLPAAGAPFHMAYYSCNGFSDNVLPNAPERIDANYLWRDLLGVHSAFPMHVLIGGGDQVYCDDAWKAPALSEWAAVESRSEKLAAPWSEAMEAQASTFYLRHYINCFMEPEVWTAFASIPGVCMWDDHDIWDGWGSYPEPIQACPVFQGLFRVAKRFYLLFQQHTTHEFNARKGELFGDGEYHFLKLVGPEVALVGIDMRSKRTKEQIIPPASYDLLEQEVLQLPASVRHLIVLSGVPVVFPRLPLAETILEGVARLTKTSRLVRKMARNTGLMDPNVGTQPEILDDLVDGWAAAIHKEERLGFIRLLQSFADRRGMRVTLLSGDAHVGGVGRLYSRPKYRDLSEDPYYMPQIISSAIVNGPPPHPVVRWMVRTNFASNVDERTREKLVRLFKHRHPRLHKLIAQRNWCDISLLVQGGAAPMHPNDSQYGALRFALRCEDPKRRRGHAEEIYDIVVPRLRPSSKVTARPARVSAAAAAKAPAVAAAAAVPAAAPAAPAPAAPAAPAGKARAQVVSLPAETVAPELQPAPPRGALGRAEAIAEEVGLQTQLGSPSSSTPVERPVAVGGADGEAVPILAGEAEQAAGERVGEQRAAKPAGQRAEQLAAQGADVEGVGAEAPPTPARD